MPWSGGGDVTSVDRLFFFQAEDGIRDYKVTGVQTCALPIYAAGLQDAPELGVVVPGPVVLEDIHVIGLETLQALLDAAAHRGCIGPPELGREIGRASCRERV